MHLVTALIKVFGHVTQIGFGVVKLEGRCDSDRALHVTDLNLDIHAYKRTSNP